MTEPQSISDSDFHVKQKPMKLIYNVFADETKLILAENRLTASQLQPMVTQLMIDKNKMDSYVWTHNLKSSQIPYLNVTSDVYDQLLDSDAVKQYQPHQVVNST